MSKPLLTVGFSTTSDPGAWWTLNLLLTQHADLRDRIEWLVIDNSPEGCKVSEEFANHVRNSHRDVRYIRDTGPASSCLYKDRLFREATGEVVVCMDSHVFLNPRAIPHIAEFFAGNPESRDMLMAPIYNAAGCMSGTNQVLYAEEGYPLPKGAEIHHGIICRGNQFGCWVKDPRGLDPTGDPYPIRMNGTWFMAMRRDAWPGFHPSMYGFGGNEVYLMERVQAAGGTVLCHPGCWGTHNFSKGGGSSYRVLAMDKLRNYLVAALELGRHDLYHATIDYFGAIYPTVIEPAKHAAQMILDDPWTATIHSWKARGGDVGGSLPKPAYNALCQFPEGYRTLEFGSGMSTLAFDRRRTKHTAIEHNADWLEKLRPVIRSPHTRLVHSPILDTWYDWRPEAGEQFDFVLVDGPPGSIGRKGCVDVVPGLLAPGGSILIDDTHREAEQQISDALVASTGLVRRRLSHGQRAYDLLTPGG